MGTTRETDRHTDTQTDRDRDRDTERQREGDRETDRDREKMKKVANLVIPGQAVNLHLRAGHTEGEVSEGSPCVGQQVVAYVWGSATRRSRDRKARS